MHNDPENFDNVDLSDIIIDDQLYIPMVEHFSYLGSVISRGVTDETDVDSRILKAGSAFGSLRKSLFGSRDVFDEVKGMAYKSLILPILLYGAECWCMTEHLFRKLRNFHHRCVRTMCHVSRIQIRVFRINTSELLQKLSLCSIDTYVSQQQLRWAGHVMRMPWNRLPRKVMSSWVRSKRPRGCPNLTYGRSLKKSLKKADIDIENWDILALDRDRWRNVIHNISP